MNNLLNKTAPSTVSAKSYECHIHEKNPHNDWNPVSCVRVAVCTPESHLRGKGSGQCVRVLLVVGGGSLRLLSDWLLCTCLSTLLFRSSSVVMIFHCRNRHKEQTSRHCHSGATREGIIPNPNSREVSQNTFYISCGITFIKLAFRTTVGSGDSFGLISWIIPPPPISPPPLF